MVKVGWEGKEEKIELENGQAYEIKYCGERSILFVNRDGYCVRIDPAGNIFGDDNRKERYGNSEIIRRITDKITITVEG